jgi:hypothetical protein
MQRVPLLPTPTSRAQTTLKKACFDRLCQRVRTRHRDNKIIILTCQNVKRSVSVHPNPTEYTQKKKKMPSAEINKKKGVLENKKGASAVQRVFLPGKPFSSPPKPSHSPPLPSHHLPSLLLLPRHHFTRLSSLLLTSAAAVPSLRLPAPGMFPIRLPALPPPAETLPHALFPCSVA